MTIRWIWIPLRVVLAIVGGYALTAAVVAVATVGLTQAGQARSEAVVLTSMLGFLFYLAVLIWAFSERRQVRLIVALIGAPLLLAAGLWLSR